MSGQETDSKDVQWMYKGLSENVDREEYLMGRKVDKTFDLIRQEEEGEKSYFDVEHDVVPKSVLERDSNSFQDRQSNPRDAVLKMKEDPLYQIKMKEIEKQKELLLNPMKMKLLKMFFRQPFLPPKMMRLHRRKSIRRVRRNGDMKMIDQDIGQAISQEDTERKEEGDQVDQSLLFREVVVKEDDKTGIEVLCHHTNKKDLIPA